MIQFSRLFGTVLIGMFFIPDSLSQINSVYYSPSDSTENISKHSVYGAGGYGNNLVYLGSSISGNQHFCYASLIYGFNGEFYLSFSAFHLSNNKPFVPIYNESLSYSHVFNSWFDIAASFSGYQANKNWADTTFADFYYGDVTLGFDWKLIYTKLSFGGLLSDVNDYYFQVRNSRYFETPEFAHKKFSVSFDPYINTIFGGYSTEETVTTTVKKSASHFSWKKKNKDTTTYTNSSFGLLEMDFGIPVTLNSDHFSIETEAGYILPFHTDPELPDGKGFTLIISTYFIIF